MWEVCFLARTHKFSVNSYCALMCKMLLLFFSIIFESSNQPGSVHVRRITDKHSVYAHKATADISLLGVRMPPHPLLPPLWSSIASFTVLPEPQWGWEGEAMADTGVVCQ